MWALVVPLASPPKTTHSSSPAFDTFRDFWRRKPTFRAPFVVRGVLPATRQLAPSVTSMPGRGLTTADCFGIVCNVLIYQWFVGGISQN